MTKHTLGPWQMVKNEREWSVERDALGSTQSQAICDDDGKIVAFAVDYSNRAFADLNTDHARLIAAAPELLEALKGLDEAYCRAGTQLTKDERHEDRMRLIAARAVIAKATGGEV